MIGRPRKYVTKVELDQAVKDLKENDFAHVCQRINSLERKVGWLLGVMAVLIPLVAAILGAVLIKG